MIPALANGENQMIQDIPAQGGPRITLTATQTTNGLIREEREEPAEELGVPGAVRPYDVGKVLGNPAAPCRWRRPGLGTDHDR